MVKKSAIAKDYSEAGSVNEFVNAYAFIDEQILLTKSGDVGVVLKAKPRDSECLDPDDLAEVARRFTTAISCFDPIFRIYQYTLKRNGACATVSTSHANPIVERALRDRAEHIESKADDLYKLDLYFVILYEGSRHRQTIGDQFRVALQDPVSFLGACFSNDKTIELIDESIARGQAILTQRVNSFIVQLRDAVELDVATKREAFALYRRLLNFNPDKTDEVGLQHDSYIDYFVCDSEIECHRDHLRVDEYFVKVLTLKDPPATTHAHMLRALQEVASPCVMATEFVLVDNFEIRKLIKSKQRHAFNSRTSFLSHVTQHDGPTGPGDQLVDQSADAWGDELGQALTALEMKGCAFGQYTLTVILYDLDKRRLEKSAADAFRTLAGLGATLYEEHYNLLNAFMAALPGNWRFNLRRVYLPVASYADLSILFAPARGEPVDRHLGAASLAAFETRQKSLYELTLHYLDLAHAAILGASGAGKSFLLNFLITCSQQYGPRTVILDLGGSYEMLTRQFGGSYLSIAPKNRTVKINPFGLALSASNHQFLASFVKVLIESSGKYTMTDADERELFTQIGSLYLIDSTQRRLTTLLHILPKHLEQFLRRWTAGGQYGDVFDNAEDTLTFAPFQTFDFAGMDEYPQIIEPMLLYILHRASAEITDPAGLATFKLCVIDEAWRFFRNDTVKQYVIEALKTWRKCNAGMVLATQSAIDLAENGLLQIVADSCATIFFLANPRVDRKQYQAAFRLNETELDLIEGLTPKRQMLIKRPDLSKVVELTVSAKDYWRYTNNAIDNELKRQAFEKYGFERGLDYLATQKRAIDNPLS
jgi:type IV secretion/conjugal transfer VirB4 family ATPase